MSGERLSNDLLLQIAEQQAADSKTLHELKGSMEARVKALETTDKRQWILHAVNAAIIGGLGLARKMGLI